MTRYEIDLHDGANILRLRPDPYRYFDKHWWAIVPKVARVADTETHSRPYLFARFAWAILFSVKGVHNRR